MAVVSIFQADGTTRIKIGRSGSLEKRQHAVHTASPFSIRLLRAIETDNAVRLETMLHKRYQPYRRHREWFELPPEVLEALLHESFGESLYPTEPPAFLPLSAKEHMEHAAIIDACMAFGAAQSMREIGTLLIVLFQESTEVLLGPFPQITQHGKELVLSVSGRINFRQIGLLYHISPERLRDAVNVLSQEKILQIRVHKERKEAPLYTLQLGKILLEHVERAMLVTMVHVDPSLHEARATLYATAPEWLVVDMPRLPS
jgi:hypothetical protein